MLYLPASQLRRPKLQEDFIFRRYVFSKELRGRGHKRSFVCFSSEEVFGGCTEKNSQDKFKVSSIDSYFQQYLAEVR